MKHVLVVDGDLEVCDVLKNFLSLNQYTVDISFHADDAIKKINDKKYTTAFINLNEPEDADRMISTFHAVSPATKLICITEHTNYRPFGIDKLLVRPFNLSEIYSTIL